MKLTNRANLPAPLVAAVSFNDYNRGDSDFSTTGLLRPAPMAALEEKFKDELETDVCDRIYALMGQAAHVVLERAALVNPDYLVEKRYSTVVTLDGKDYKISGQLDLYDPETKTLWDWKTSSVWKEIMGDKDDWIAQGSINKFILEANGIEVNKIQYIVFYRDWKKRDSFREDYPKEPVGVYDFGELWTPTQTLDFIKDRLNAHLSARNGHPGVCSKEERWCREATYAVIKGENKRATKVFSSKEEAEQMARTDPKYRVEIRPEENVRCQDYCLVARFCEKGKTLI